MKSKSFSRSKQYRCATKSLQKDIKTIKKQRIRTDRRASKILLKTTQDETKLSFKISLNDGSWKII